MTSIITESCFEKTPELECEKVENELLIYDSGSEKVHNLNGTAAFIWLSCDGTRETGEIVEEIADEFTEVAKDEIQAHVFEAIRNLLELDLIRPKNE